ncbi:MAG TPA: DUF6370 family protein [Pirellulaceae bacterium]|jgi:hypothetical protein
MKSFLSLAGLSLAIALVAFTVVADDKAKDVTLKGKILCAKCNLKQTSECTTAIQVKEGDKLATYLFDDKGAGEEYHEPICGGSEKEGTVTGAVEERNGKKYIKPTKVEYAQK